MVDQHTHRKAKSAPPRFSSRDDVWKNIRDWAKPITSGTNNAIGAQLKDNVTEQRMLESRLLDLSKERYKFNVQVAWQRKTFVDKQRTKAGQMKELLAGIEAAHSQSIKQNQTKQLNTRKQQHYQLKLEAYSNRQKSRNGSENFLAQKKPICIEPVFKTQTMTAHPASRSMFNSRSRQTTFPDIRNLSKEQDYRSSSVPPRLMPRSIVQSGNARTILRPMCRSTESIPRYLQYRSIYDSRFSNLERTLCDPVKRTADGKKSLDSLLSVLPTRPTTSTSIYLSPRSPGP